MHMMNKCLKTHVNPPLNIRKTMDEDDDYFDPNAIDKLSNLHTDLICHILSFLPTKEAVATSVLSTKWRNIFCLIPNLRLHLYDTLLPNPGDASITTLINFMSFANRLLNITSPDTLSIQKLHLDCRVFGNGKIIADWVGAALRHNLRDLAFGATLLIGPNHLFNALYGCTLVTLSMCLMRTGRKTSTYMFSLPNLKVFQVMRTEFEIVNGIVQGSSLLESLTILNCYGEVEQNLRIKSPSLKILDVCNGLDSPLGEFHLDAPNLEEFTYDGFLNNHYSLKKTKSLNIARLDNCEHVIQLSIEDRDRAVQVVNACSDCQNLCLSELYVMALDALPILPLFLNLISLTLVKLDTIGWRVMLRILDSAPNLRRVIVNEGLTKECCGDIVFLDNERFIQILQRCDVHTLNI